mgnify:CR=1 FL=1
MISAKEVEDAYDLLKAVVTKTPLQLDPYLSNKYQANIYLKEENLQKVRSFKLRGAYYSISKLSDEQRSKGVVCASAGNHAQGVAFAANQLNISATIFMPVTTPNQKISQVKFFGESHVTIRLIGDTFDESARAAKAFSQDNDKPFIDPFDDENVMRENNREDAFIDPMADIETINLELILADLESVNKRYARVEKVARTAKDKDAVAEFNVLKKLKPVLEDGKTARTIDFDEDETKVLKSLFLLTSKPVLYVANVSEDEVGEPDNIEYVKQIRDFAATENAEVAVISARVEEEISELEDDEKAEFLEAIGLKESGVDMLTRAAYHLLGLATYFTAGEKEVRAWTFKRGMKAPQMAGIIHTDFEKGFIRAVTMSYDDLLKYGSEKAVREAGRLREEGKEYVGQDGDIMEFRFNV